jgi:hypothetical protein
VTFALLWVGYLSISVTRVVYLMRGARSGNRLPGVVRHTAGFARTGWTGCVPPGGAVCGTSGFHGREAWPLGSATPGESLVGVIELTQSFLFGVRINRGRLSPCSDEFGGVKGCCGREGFLSQT